MKVAVIEEFIDKYDNSKVYNVGEVVDFADNNRVEDLINRKLVIAVDAATDKPKKTAAKRKRID